MGCGFNEANGLERGVELGKKVGVRMKGVVMMRDGIGTRGGVRGMGV